MPGAEGSDCRLSGVKVLASEDNELNAEILRELLHMNGVVCDIVSNCQELLDAFEKSGSGQYDLILTDIQMPVMNGYDATLAIRKMKDTKKARIPIIAMTANAFEEDRKKAIKAGMNAHIAKPISVDIILENLERMHQSVSENSDTL